MESSSCPIIFRPFYVSGKPRQAPGKKSPTATASAFASDSATDSDSAPGPGSGPDK